MLNFISRQGATLTADRLTNRLNRRLMANRVMDADHEIDSQNQQGRSLTLHTNRIACMRNQGINEYGAIVLGPMTKTRNHDGQDWRVYMPFPVTVPIKAGSK